MTTIFAIFHFVCFHVLETRDHPCNTTRKETNLERCQKPRDESCFPTCVFPTNAPQQFVQMHALLLVQTNKQTNFRYIKNQVYYLPSLLQYVCLTFLPKTFNQFPYLKLLNIEVWCLMGYDMIFHRPGNCLSYLRLRTAKPNALGSGSI